MADIETKYIARCYQTHNIWGYPLERCDLHGNDIDELYGPNYWHVETADDVRRDGLDCASTELLRSGCSHHQFAPDEFTAYIQAARAGFIRPKKGEKLRDKNTSV